jgi:hypothetical protein
MGRTLRGEAVLTAVHGDKATGRLGRTVGGEMMLEYLLPRNLHEVTQNNHEKKLGHSVVPNEFEQGTAWL